MSKTELIKTVSDSIGVRRAAVMEVFNAVFEEIMFALERGEEVNIPGFGKFFVKMSTPRTCRNPRTGDMLEVAAKRMPKFKWSSVVKKAVIEE